jgi:hypothetical protein
MPSYIFIKVLGQSTQETLIIPIAQINSITFTAIYEPVIDYLTESKSHLYEIPSASELIFKEVGRELIITEQNYTENPFMPGKTYQIELKEKVPTSVTDGSSEQQDENRSDSEDCKFAKLFKSIKQNNSLKLSFNVDTEYPNAEVIDKNYSEHSYKEVNSNPLSVSAKSYQNSQGENPNINISEVDPPKFKEDDQSIPSTFQSNYP